MPSIGELFQDRNFLSMLAGTGARLGAGGAGEAIGVPTQQWIQSLATQEAVAKQEAKRDEIMEMIRPIIAGISPKEMAGFTSMKIGPDKMTVDITPPGGATNTTNLDPRSQGAKDIFGGGMTPASGGVGFDYKSLLQGLAPFLQALGG